MVGFWRRARRASAHGRVSQQKAKVVIVGLGGIVGASVAHHLIERGWDDIVGIDKSGIPTDVGSTAHASDFCYTTSHDFMSVLDDALFHRFLREDGQLRAHRRP
jgi:glycine/D-amino acid oxidase-like deaminating enzyme